MTNEEILIEGAKTFSSRELALMFQEYVERGLEINNSGTLKVAAIIGRELLSRGVEIAGLKDYVELIETAVADAEAKRT